MTTPKKINPTYQRIYDMVRRIPKGKVATYGQIARLSKLPGQARLVGYALHNVPEDLEIPWHRVINSKGTISLLPDPESRTIQHHLLLSEGISIDLEGRISLDRFQWNPNQMSK